MSPRHVFNRNILPNQSTVYPIASPHLPKWNNFYIHHKRFVHLVFKHPLIHPYTFS